METRGYVWARTLAVLVAAVPLSCAARGPDQPPLQPSPATSLALAPPALTATGDAGTPLPAPAPKVKVASSLFVEAPHISMSGLAIAGNGDAYAVGSFRGKLSVGDVAIEHAAVFDEGFVIRLDGAGAPRWGTTVGDSVVGIAGGPRDEIALLGASTEKGRKLGGITLPKSPFVALIGPSGPRWVREVSGGEATQLAFMPDGGIIVYGNFSDRVAVGALPARALRDPSGTKASDVFVARLSAEGKPVWLRRFGSQGDDRSGSLAVSAQGRIIITGSFNMPIALGTTTLEDLPPGAVEPNAFIASLDGDGGVLWARRLPVPLTVVLADSDGGVLLGGEPGVGRPGPVTVLAKLDERGALVWTQQLVCERVAGIHSLARTRSGDVVAAGRCGAARLRPDAPMLARYATDSGFVERIRPDGTVVWATSLGGPGVDALALRNGEEPVVASQIDTFVELDTGVLRNKGAGAAFLAWLSAP